MLNAVIRFSLRYRQLIVLLSAAVLVYGTYTASRLPIDVFPDLDRPRVSIMTECPGMATQDVETLVTEPLEAALLGATGVQAVRSESGPSLSVVNVEFDWGTNIHIARQVVQERLTSLPWSLPDGIKPSLAPISSIMGQIMLIGMSRTKPGAHAEKTGEDMELRSLADWIIRPRLLKVPGIAQITTMGGGRRQYQVLVDPEAMFHHGVTLEQIEASLRANNLNASGGFAQDAGKEIAIRVFGRLGPTPKQVLAELRRIPVKQTEQRTILLEQVASRIVEAPQQARGDASVNGRSGVLINVHKQPHVDTRQVTDEILAALDDVRATLPADIELNAEVFQMKGFIERGIFNVGEALVIGAVLVLIILFLFLLNFRTTFISLTAIPLSLAISALVFKVIGWLTGTQLSINVMTLGGLAVAMGELVDDAIVDVENIFRRLRENRAQAEPRAPLSVIYWASVEIRSAIVFGTMVVILVFLPLFALPGLEGRLFAPLAVAYIVSILASLVVSLSVTPVLSYYLLPQAQATHRTGDSPLLRALKFGAQRLICFSMAYPGLILLASWLLVVGAVIHLTRLGSDFLPPFDEGSIQVNLSLPAGASLQASNEMCRLVDERFRTLRKSKDNPNGLILNFVRMSGRAELDEHAEPVSSTHYILSLNPYSGKSRAEAIDQIYDLLKGSDNQPGLVPYADVEVEQPLAHLISHMLSGTTAHLAVKVFGDDLDQLRRLAQQVKSVIADVEGIAEPVIEAQQSIEEVHIELRGPDLALHGIDREHVARFVKTALQGEVVSQIIEGQKRTDLVLRLDEPFRNHYSLLKRLRLDVPDKKTAVLLGDIADITPGYGPNYVKHENARRRLVVRVNVQGRDLGSVAEEIDGRLRRLVSLPPGYFIELGGQFESQREATWAMGLLSVGSAIAMFFVLYMLYPSVRIVLQILNALPTAFIGGVLALVLTNQTVTVAALVGFISLGGIAVRNGILLVTHYFHLMRHEHEGFTREMILRGSLERLAPVLMTALTAGIALVPLVVGGQQPGREILYPVATVILGGLITSTLCEFLIHPGLFWRFSGKDAQRLAHLKPVDPAESLA